MLFRSAMKINSMIHRIVEFDRIDTNYNSSLILSAVDIVELIGSAFEFAKEKNEGNKNQVWEFRSDCDSVIMNADVLKIESIINILLSNASKFGFENGKISLSIVKTDSVCIIEITDSGIGIPQKDQPYVTQRFFQASNNKDKKEGTGIGLYLAKMYTELHNGVLSISSVEGEGTSVIVSLPLAEIDQKDAENKNPEYMMLQAMQLMAQNDIRKKKQRINNLLPTGDDIKPMISADEEFLANVTSVIEDHIDDFELNVTSLCEHLDINNKQLYRKVKQLTGVSPVEYIKIIRMKKAAMLLKQNKFTVSEIVYMVGFSNASYFSKCFQNEFGQTTKSYVESVLSEKFYILSDRFLCRMGSKLLLFSVHNLKTNAFMLEKFGHIILVLLDRKSVV